MSIINPDFSSKPLGYSQGTGKPVKPEEAGEKISIYDTGVLSKTSPQDKYVNIHPKKLITCYMPDPFPFQNEETKLQENGESKPKLRKPVLCYMRAALDGTEEKQAKHLKPPGTGGIPKPLTCYLPPARPQPKQGGPIAACYMPDPTDPWGPWGPPKPMSTTLKSVVTCYLPPPPTEPMSVGLEKDGITENIRRPVLCYFMNMSAEKLGKTKIPAKIVDAGFTSSDNLAGLTPQQLQNRLKLMQKRAQDNLNG